jgi:predicted nucleic acid-binding protein
MKELAPSIIRELRTIGVADQRPWWTRAVLDTSVLISEHRHWLWLLARRSFYEGVWSAFIVGELVRVRTELSIKKGAERAVYRQRINDLIHLFSDVLAIVDYRRVTTGMTLKDPDDEPILATAIAADAGCVVSLNTRDFPEGGVVDGVRYVTPQQFLDALSDANKELDLPALVRTAGKQTP